MLVRAALTKHVLPPTFSCRDCEQLPAALTGPDLLHMTVCDISTSTLGCQAAEHHGSHAVPAKQITVAVCVFAFDLLYVDGEALVRQTLRERRARLDAVFPCK